ncbi:hypothetical protein Tco_0872057 [Tanacetum coccineum]
MFNNICIRIGAQTSSTGLITFDYVKVRCHEPSAIIPVLDYGICAEVLGFDWIHIKLLWVNLQVDINNSPIFVRYPNLQGKPDIGTAVEYRKASLASLDVSALDKPHYQLENMLRIFIHESNPDDACTIFLL